MCRGAIGEQFDSQLELIEQRQLALRVGNLGFCPDHVLDMGQALATSDAAEGLQGSILRGQRRKDCREAFCAHKCARLARLPRPHAPGDR